MKNILCKSFLVLSVLFTFLVVSPQGHSLASASSIDSTVNLSNNGASGNVSTEGLIEPFAEIGPTYPGTSVQMKIGDILYSTKTLGGSTAIVGHVGIVDSNFKVVHVTPAVDGGVIDNFTNYMNRHGSGETIVVYRPRDGMGVGAARWANYNYYNVTDYSIDPLAKLGTISPNYCSKFVWQAFYYGEGVDLMGVNNTPDLRGFVTPSNIAYSPYVVRYATFLTP
ncbi:hypothetical protein RW092_13295 [Paenibacillus sp. 3LSP]|uniref:Permuted papain-like amidase enzyme, YaeF/YiiX, C92 family n=1 Tax=Paenibacillus antibioticophila TaxID=1274374 RepID=A0A920CIA9_9BACL|nr:MULTISPECIES: hypothetical protein [Paenibacillus]MDU0331164.1 hypothetical protein [Paenibacillus sp. 3LSP]GIO38109.1 hypothetical protein J41TS12_29700 [Paenibacillus antibioticophila]